MCENNPYSFLDIDSNGHPACDCHLWASGDLSRPGLTDEEDRLLNAIFAGKEEARFQDSWIRRGFVDRHAPTPSVGCVLRWFDQSPEYLKYAVEAYIEKINFLGHRTTKEQIQRMLHYINIPVTL